MRWLAATLVALLGVSYAILMLGAPSVKVHPAPDDTGLGGLSLFAEALRDAGYRVAFDPAARPRLSERDIAIVPLLGGRNVPESVTDFVSKGHRAFALDIPKELQPLQGEAEIRNWQGQKAKIDLVERSGGFAHPKSLARVASWSGDDNDAASLSQIGKGRLARLDVGAIATNRFLGRRDNARVVFSTFQTLQPKPGDQIVFLAMGYGEGEDLGPIEAIGPWAVGLLWQSLAILGAYGIVRGIRFGLSAPDRTQKRGSRELLDALAEHYRRGRRTEAPLMMAARERPDDPAIQSLALRPKVSEAEARQALVELESKPKPRR